MSENPARDEQSSPEPGEQPQAPQDQPAPRDQETPQDQDAPQQGETIGATGDAQNPALEKDPSDWVSGDEPMTQSQKSYLDTLAKRAGEELPATLTKSEASEHIDRLRGAQF